LNKRGVCATSSRWSAAAHRSTRQAANTAGLKRQQPGAMGLGTSQQKVTPPAGWKPPPKPDPMTKGRPRGR
jgi:hypothetical protein